MGGEGGGTQSWAEWRDAWGTGATSGVTLVRCDDQIKDLDEVPRKCIRQAQPDEKSNRQCAAAASAPRPPIQHTCIAQALCDRQDSSSFCDVTINILESC